jgi:hypothetical protein
MHASSSFFLPEESRFSFQWQLHPGGIVDCGVIIIHPFMG